MAPSSKKYFFSFDFGVKYSAHFCNHLYSKDQMHASHQSGGLKEKVQ